MVDIATLPVEVASGSSDDVKPRGYLFGKALDFLCLGGGSLPILLVLLALPSDQYKVAVLITAVFASHFVNNPHFMASYQIFYAGFRRKLAGYGYPRAMRLRYLIAGIIVPLAIIIFFAYAVSRPDALLLGRAVNAMLFLVGWHYVKQGYGILIVESVLKKRFFDQTEKDVLKYNGFAVWIVSWMYTNRAVSEQSLYGLEYFTFQVPEAVLMTSALVAIGTSLAAGWFLLRKALIRGQALPVNGVLAYLTSAYVWLCVARLDVLMLIVVPVFHSLQYLAVVWRYQLNKGIAETARETTPVTLLSGLITLSPARFHLLRFVFIGMMLGAMAFQVVPHALDYAIAYREEIFGPTLFLFLFTIFINVHHYFLDNVMWRKENPDIREHLFSAH